MRFSFPAGARGTIYDRGAANKNIGFTGFQLGPHGTTTRATYTVPANRRAYVGGGWISATRFAAATGAGAVICTVQVPGASLPNAEFINVAVDSRYNEGCPVENYMTVGQQAQLLTSDGSTGGTVDYHLSATIMEFDQ